MASALVATRLAGSLIHCSASPALEGKRPHLGKDRPPARLCDGPGLPPPASISRRALRSALLRTRALSDERNSSPSDFNLAEYVEARVEDVTVKQDVEGPGRMILLRLLDGSGNLLPVFIGDFESAALQKELERQPTGRPLTHDLFKSTVELLGYKVTKVRIHTLANGVYHARMHFSRTAAGGAGAREELDIDARPSDALNAALRFGAPIYVAKGIAVRMGQAVSAEPRVETHGDIRRSCREEAIRHHDPTVVLSLQMQLAISEERYEDAATIKEKVDQLFARDRGLALLVAMEAALEGERWEEAGTLRDQLRMLTAKRDMDTHV